MEGKYRAVSYKKTVLILEISKGNLENITIGICVLHILKWQDEQSYSVCDWLPKQARWGY